MRSKSHIPAVLRTLQYMRVLIMACPLLPHPNLLYSIPHGSCAVPPQRAPVQGLQDVRIQDGL